MPVLAIAGAGYLQFPVSVVRELAQTIHGASLVEAATSADLAALDRRIRWNRWIAALLDTALAVG
ncbi:hypothetical protein [Rhodopila sp.]|uniref:hypothetical protein n=1 Tax=Rhodopila sp. TaxID=2480087 RepID=UPI003D0B2C80